MVDRKGGTTSKTPAQPIKNYNMGIVYPKAVEKKPFELSQNDKILKAAHDQLNSLRTNAPSQNVGQNASTKSGISQLQQSNRTVSRPVMTAINRTNDLRITPRTVDKHAISSPSGPIKSNFASSLPTNEVTITPTKRIQKVATSANSISQHKGSPMTSVAPSVNRKPSVELNKISNLPISTLSTVSRLPASTSITRQTTMPIVSANANTLAARVANLPKISKPMPPLSRQGSLPTLKLIQPNNNVFNQNNNKQSSLIRTANPITTAASNISKQTTINRNSTNQIPRVVTTSTNQNGATKPPALVQRTTNITPSGARKVISVDSNPTPKLLNFPT